MTPICGAKRHQQPGVCRQPAGWGTDHPGVGKCKLHGGSTRNHRSGPANDRLQAEVRTLLGREDLVPIADPLHQLQLLAAEVLRIKDIFADKVERLIDWTTEDISEKEEVRAVILAYERALDRCDHVLHGMARLDIDARLARVSEVQAAMLIRVVEAVLDSRELGLDREARILGRTILAQELANVSST